MPDVLRHYLHRPLLLLGTLEALLLFVCAYVGAWISLGTFPGIGTFMPSALAFTGVMVLAMMATDVYGARIREGLPGMTVRTVVGLFVVGVISLAVVFYALPVLDMGRSPLLMATGVGFVAIGASRWLAFRMLSDEVLKTRVLVLGSGERALRIATRMRRSYDQRGFELHGYVLVEGSPNLVSSQGARVWQPTGTLREFVQEHGIDEIVMALDGSHAGDGDPLAVRLDEVLACRMAGISVVDAVTFVEREAGRIDLELLTPAWLALTRGFGRRGLERAVKRVLDVLLGVLLLVLSTPLMVLALIWALIGRGVTLARETCIGLDGCAFQRLTLDVAGTGRIRRLLRGLPQLLHVLAGTMSLVGPSPVSTDEWARLSAELVFWGERRNLRPGILGWAQLNCGAGEAEKDAVEKLQYDLYYLKNHTLLLDLAILVQAAQMLVFSRNG